MISVQNSLKASTTFLRIFWLKYHGPGVGETGPTVRAEFGPHPGAVGPPSGASPTFLGVRRVVARDTEYYEGYYKGYNKSHCKGFRV